MSYKLLLLAAAASCVAGRITLDSKTILEKLEDLEEAILGEPGAKHHDEEGVSMLPQFFDMRTVWWGCGLTVHNQGQCGSCWAASSTGVINDRFCIHKDSNDDPLEVSRYGAGALNRAFMEAGSCDKANSLPHDHGCTKRTTILSPQRLVSCATMTVYPKTYFDSAGCNGGNAADAWHYFHVHGLSSMSGDGNNGCNPYVSGKCLLKDPHNNGCLPCVATDECSDSGNAPKIHKVGQFGKIRDPGMGAFNHSEPVRNKSALQNQIRMIKEEIYANGPVQSCFVFPANFQQFFNEHPLGIYNTTKGQNITGSHCVALTGWGRDADSGLDYWIIRNSFIGTRFGFAFQFFKGHDCLNCWGDAFGSKGYYRWKMGENLCGIEHEAWTGCPLNSKTCKLTKGVQVVTPDPQNVEEPVPYHNGINDIAFGGKWMTHDASSEVAQHYAHQFARRAMPEGAANGMQTQPGDYDVQTVQTKVTNVVIARVAMTLPGHNSQVEAVLRHNADDSYTILESNNVSL